MRLSQILPKLGFRHAGRHSDYLRGEFTSVIERGKVRRIFELGARDGQDTLLLRDFYSAHVTAFECNPKALEICRRTLRGRRRVDLVEVAVWDQDTEIPFFPVESSTWSDGRLITDGDGNVMNNIGASSCFRARDDYLQRYHQGCIRVPAIRLDSHCRQRNVRRVDLICMDVQGAGLQALTGLGDFIGGVRYIIAELEWREIYHGQSLYDEVDAYLRTRGFVQRVRVARDEWFSDFLYVNEN